MLQGTVLRIEKISPNDGQGLRTVIFLKGCPLRCAWCSTPESQSRAPEWSYRQAKCVRCGSCVRACPNSALSLSPDGTEIVRDRQKCADCFACAAACPERAIAVYGATMDTERLMREIRKDSLFYFYSGGGVTLSGGDILLQADFAAELLRKCREECIDTTAELDMYGPYENVAKVMPFLCSCFVDIKLMDGAEHRRWTGVDNASVLANTLRASADFPDTPMHIRVPLIAGVNDSGENIRATADFCRRLGSCASLELLPYHRLGSASYRYLARPYALSELPAMTFDEALARASVLKGEPLPFPVLISGKEIFA